MVSENRNQVQLDVYGALASVDRLVGDGADYRVRCYFDYGSYDYQIGSNGKKFNCKFNCF